MTKLSYRIRRPVRGIKEENHYQSRVSTFDTRDDEYDNVDLDELDIYAIKNLKDKIKILEIELQKAREESFRAGYQEGKENTLQDANRRISEMTNKMQEMENSFVDAFEKLEGPVLNLAKRMARIVLSEELKIRDDHDELLIKKLREMLYQLIDQNQVIIKLNPEQLSRLKNRDIKEELDLPKQMEITQIADQKLESGEAVIQTEDFFIDASYKNELDQVEDQLKDETNDV